MKNSLLVKISLFIVVAHLKLTSAHAPITNTPLAILSKPSTIKVTSLVSGTWHEQGVRPTMEDTDVDYETSAGLHIAGVFDGHGGRTSADIAAKNLPQAIINDKSFALNDKETCVKNAFLTLDALCCQNTQDGATAVVALVDNNMLYIANAGDARAVIAHKEGKAEQLSYDHKANDPKEKERIEKQGGLVITIGIPRVQGVLAVARALGDAPLKPLVTAEPFIKKIALTQQDQFLILACDGVWDVLQNQQAVDFVNQQLHAINATPQSITPQQAEYIARALVLHALQNGSTDNVTAKIIFFNHMTTGKTRQDN